MNKQQQRFFFLEKRKTISAEMMQEKSQKICKQIAENEQFLKAKTVAFFAPISGEIDLFPLLQQCVQQKKCVFPKVENREKREMNFFAVEKEEDLGKGFAGILEPKKNAEKIELEKIDFFLVPAVAVDMQKNRLGMGMGFYDRVLANATNAFTMAVVPQECVAKKIFTENHDISMDGIIFC